MIEMECEQDFAAPRPDYAVHLDKGGIRIYSAERVVIFLRPARTRQEQAVVDIASNTFFANPEVVPPRRHDVVNGLPLLQSGIQDESDLTSHIFDFFSPFRHFPLDKFTKFAIIISVDKQLKKYTSSIPNNGRNPK